jgi:hypothetical protein
MSWLGQPQAMRTRNGLFGGRVHYRAGDDQGWVESDHLLLALGRQFDVVLAKRLFRGIEDCPTGNPTSKSRSLTQSSSKPPVAFCRLVRHSQCAPLPSCCGCVSPPLCPLPGLGEWATQDLLDQAMNAFLVARFLPHALISVKINGTDSTGCLLL